MRLIYFVVLNNIFDFMSLNFIVSNYYLILGVYFFFYVLALGCIGENLFRVKYSYLEIVFRRKLYLGGEIFF